MTSEPGKKKPLKTLLSLIKRHIAQPFAFTSSFTIKCCLFVLSEIALEIQYSKQPFHISLSPWPTDFCVCCLCAAY